MKEQGRNRQKEVYGGKQSDQESALQHAQLVRRSFAPAGSLSILRNCLFLLTKCLPLFLYHCFQVKQLVDTDARHGVSQHCGIFLVLNRRRGEQEPSSSRVIIWCDRSVFLSPVFLHFL